MNAKHTTLYLRGSLWLTAPLNLLVALALANPAGLLGSLLQLPPSEHVFYRLLAALMVGLFGCVYFHQAMQSYPDRKLILLGACGKTIAALVAIVLTYQGQLTLTAGVLFSGDLLLAALWFYWLYD